MFLYLLNTYCFYKSNSPMLWNFAIIFPMQNFKRKQWLSKRKNSNIWRIFLQKTHLLYLGWNTFLFFFLLFILLNYLSQEDVKESKYLKEIRFLSPTIPKFRNPFKTDFSYNDHSSFLRTFPAYCSIGQPKSLLDSSKY